MSARTQVDSSSRVGQATRAPHSTDGTDIYLDRRDAGRQLGAALQHLAGTRPLILGLPRGGIPVAHEVATALAAPLDVLVVRKIGAPSNPEFAIGAVGEDGSIVADEEVASDLGINSDDLHQMAQLQSAEIDRRVRTYRNGRPMMNVRNRTTIVVDDGLATGSTAAAAVAVLRHLGAARIIVAVPTGAWQAVHRLQFLADEVVCLSTPEWFQSVGQQYRDFTQTTDEEVTSLLSVAHGSRDAEVLIPLRPPIVLHGRFTIPSSAFGVVVFAHGSGSSRLSPRNQAVAHDLNASGIGTLLFDLLTDGEARDRANTFDIPLLASRLEHARQWLRDQPLTQHLPVGLFGASTGAAAALVAAAHDPTGVRAIVSRGGRPDLAGSDLPGVTAPTLLIVGGLDLEVLEMNRDARDQMTCESEIAIVPGATHLFEEPGTLHEASRLAREWFTRHLRSSISAP